MREQWKFEGHDDSHPSPPTPEVLMVLCSHANLAFCDLNCRHLHEHEIVKWNCKEVIYCDVRKKRVACEEVYENLKEIK